MLINKNIIYLTLSIFLSTNSYSSSNLNLIFTGSLTYSGPADKISIGELIGPSWVSEGSQTRMCTSSQKDLAVAKVIPISSPTNLYTTIDGIQYIIFETGTPGIGWVMGVKDKNATQFSPLLNTTTQWYPSQGTATDTRISIGGVSRISLIKTAQHLKTGQTTLPAQTLAKVVCMNENGGIVDQAEIKINQQPINIKATGCVVNGAVSQIVEMGRYTTKDFPNIGSTSQSKSLKIPLTCNPNIELKATVSDQSNTSNISDIISLSPESTAKGLGVQIFHNDKITALNMGPDNTSANNINQFDITTITGANNVEINVPFSFKYIRTGTITPGNANALVGITFSYQ